MAVAAGSVVAVALGPAADWLGVAVMLCVTLHVAEEAAEGVWVELAAVGCGLAVMVPVAMGVAVVEK